MQGRDPLTHRLAALALPLALLLGAHGPAMAKVAAEQAVRADPGKVVVSWTDANPVDVYVSDRPDADLAHARLVSGHNAAGSFEAVAGPAERPYFLLKDSRDGAVVRVAERVLPLQQGSNFRDVGGYPAAGGKHLRWGKIFRSAGQPMLTDADVAQVQSLGVENLIDLRSDEERLVAPTRLDGIRYSAVGYSMSRLSTGDVLHGDDGIHEAYRRFPTLLAPQLRILFRTLLADEGAVAYNCSAGQDRTGFATAMVLSALGVPRDVIFTDYHLSTTYRRPQWEMAKIDPARVADTPGLAFFVKMQADPKSLTPHPMIDSQGHSWLEFAFAEIDRKWGSVDNYLAQELGVDAAARAKLRAEYLE